MQLIKKIFYSILILAGIGIMVVLFMFAIMMVFHVSIFGYTYANVTKNRGNVYDFENSSFSQIEIETNAVNIDFYYTSDAGQTNASVVLYEDFQGIIKDEVKRYSFTEEPKVADGILKISTTEPEGLLFKNSTTVRIGLPQGKVLDKISVKTKSDNVSFGNDDTLFQVKDLSVVSTKKSLNPGVTLGSNLKVTDNLYLETYAGRINVNAEIGGNVSVKTNMGTVLFNKSINGNVNISGDNPNVEFGSVPSGFINDVKAGKAYNTSSLKQVDINGDLNIDNVENGGCIKVSGTIGGLLYMKSPNMLLWANNVDGGIICNGGSNEIIIFGSLSKTTPNLDCTLTVGNKLLINNPYASLTIFADKNGVDIRNAHNNVYVDNKNWGTTVSFADDADGKTLTVIQEHGNIIANNISSKARLCATNGKVTAMFAKVVGDNEIKALSGADITVKDGLTYKLVAKSRKNTSINIDLGSRQFKDWSKAQEIGEYRQIETFVPQGTTDTANTLSVYVTEQGDLKVALQ